MGDRIIDDRYRLDERHPVERPTSATEVREESIADSVTATLPRLTGRHRIHDAVPAWPPDRPAAVAWLRRWWIAVVSAALILFTVSAVTLLLTGGDGDRPPVATPDAGAPEASYPSREGLGEPTPAPTSVTPTAPTISPSVSRTPATGAIDRLAAFSSTVQRLVDSGDLEPKEGRELQRRAASAAISVQNGRNAGAIERLRDLDQRLEELRRDGKISSASFAALDVIDPIIAQLG